MTDEELQVFLDSDRSPHTYDELLDEWKAWAKAVIQSAKVGVGGKGHVQPNDAVFYLCQIMQVFEGLLKGVTEDDLRGKFVSGLVLSGLPPQKDASFFFTRALADAKSRGYITCKEVDRWHPGMPSGSGWDCLYELTLAGQRLADIGGNAEPSEVPHQKENQEEPQTPIPNVAAPLTMAVERTVAPSQPEASTDAANSRADLPSQEPSYILTPPNLCAWKVSAPIELTPLQWKLLAYCLANRRAEIQDVADHVWGEKSASDKSEGTIDSLKSKLNTRLSEANIPITLSRKQGFLILSIDG